MEYALVTLIRKPSAKSRRRVSAIVMQRPNKTHRARVVSIGGKIMQMKREKVRRMRGRVVGVRLGAVTEA